MNKTREKDGAWLSPEDKDPGLHWGPETAESGLPRATRPSPDDALVLPKAQECPTAAVEAAG